MLMVVAAQPRTPRTDTVSVPGLVGLSVTVAVPRGPSRTMRLTPGPLRSSVVPAAGVPWWAALMVMVCGRPLAVRLPLIETVGQTSAGLGGGVNAGSRRVITDAVAVHGPDGSGVQDAIAMFAAFPGTLTATSTRTLTAWLPTSVPTLQ
jgi:hypothetical protein